MKKNFLLFSITILLTHFSFPQTASLEPTLKINYVNGAAVPFQNGIPLPGFEKQNRTTLNLKGIWKKERVSLNHNYTLAKRDASGLNNITVESAGRYQQNYSDVNWQNKNIPSVENTMNTYPTVPEYYEDGVWYRYNFNVNSDLNGQFAKLIFYAGNYVTDVWLNGKYLGYHEGGYTPFSFDVSGQLNFSDSNTIAIRIDNPQWDTRNDIVPYVKADWFNYTGIIHDIYLEFSNPSSVMRADIVPLNISGDIKTSAVIFNKDTADKNLDVKFEVFNTSINENNIRTEKASDLISTLAQVSGVDQKSFVVKKDSAYLIETTLNVSNPKLWSPKTPNLYVLKVTLSENGVVKDEYYTQFGIRKIETSGKYVLLNGKPIFFTGLARHEDHPLYGRSIPVDTIYSDLVKVKDFNANFIRTAHYPNHLQTYLLADRLGLAVMEEIPVFWFDNATSWSIQNSQRHIHEQMFREMVYRDFNRPSIMLWSTCNECLEVNGRALFIKKMQDDQPLYYNDNRLITESAAADRPGPTDFSQDFCDVMGWTMYFGIFHGSTYYAGTANFLLNASTYRPLKPILDTEFGYWSSENGSTQSTQTYVFTETFKAFKNSAAMNPDGTLNKFGYLMGVTWWCIFDWYTAGHPNGYQSMGLMNMERTTIKPVGSSLKTGYYPYFNNGGVVSSILQDDNISPNKYYLEQNYPNPFNPETNINFAIPEKGSASLKIYDILGKEVAVLFDKEFEPGTYNVKINSIDLKLSSGVYFYKIRGNNFNKVRKMILLK